MTTKQAYERLGVEYKPRRSEMPMAAHALIAGIAGGVLLALIGWELIEFGPLHGGALIAAEGAGVYAAWWCNRVRRGR